MHVTIFNPQTGAIRDCVEVFDANDAPLQAQSGEDWIEATSDPNRHMIVNGAIVDRPQAEIDAYEIDQAWGALRGKRNALLKACDWTQVPDAPVGQAAWATYRQALRDLPANTTDPREVVWPEPPD